MQDLNGRFIREPVEIATTPAGVRLFQSVPVHVKIPIGFALADAAVLWTVPPWMAKLFVEMAGWEMTTDWAGGSSSAIGLSASVAPHTGKGDLLGGASGDLEATLTAAAGFQQGTIGVSFSAAPKAVVLAAGTDIRFDRITSIFTSGAGFAHLVGRWHSA